jgi:anti-sigma-K factor RskA
VRSIRRSGVTVCGVVLRRRGQNADGDHQVAELAALADGSIAPERRSELEEQVGGSAELTALLAEQERAVALAQNAAAATEAPASLRARVEAQQRPQRARRAPAPRRLALAGAAAIVVVGAVALGIGLFASGTSGQRFQAALAATALSPGASGKATLTKTSSGWQIELHASGLPHLDGGRFYEAWLRNGAGMLVPVGSFNDGRNVTLWAGVSPKQFRTLTVTRERADGNQSSSGEKVLVGTVDVYSG